MSETEDHLLPELKDYIIQKGEPLPLWLAPVPPRNEYPSVGVSTDNNLPQGNKSLSFFPRKSHKPHWRKHPPKPLFIGLNILDCPLEPDPKKSWTQVSISTTHAQSNSSVNRPLQVSVRREMTYKYGPMDTQLKPDGHKYDALLSRHLQAIGERSPFGFQSSSSIQHSLDDRSQSDANSCTPLSNTSKSLSWGSNPVSVQPMLGMVPTEVPNPIPKSWSSVQPNYGSTPSQSIESHDLVSKSNLSQDPKPPISPGSKTIVPHVSTIVPIVGSISSLYIDSDEISSGDFSEDSKDSDDSFKDSDDDIDAESLVGLDSDSVASSPDIPNLSPYVPSSLNCQNMGKCTLSHYSSKFDDSTLDGFSTDDSDQEDFLQPGTSQGTTSTSFGANTHQVQRSGSNFFPVNTITQTGEDSFPLMPSKSNNSHMVNVGSLNCPRVLHSNMVKHTSSHSPTLGPVLVEPVRSSLVGKRIAAGLRFKQNTIGISDSLACVPTEGGILYNSFTSSPFDNSENISDGYDSSVSLDCSNITQEVISKLTKVPSEDVSSPFSLVNTDIPPTVDSVPLVDTDLVPYWVQYHEDKKLFSGSPNELLHTQSLPSTASNCNTLVGALGDIDSSNSQLNYKGLVSLASNQPQ